MVLREGGGGRGESCAIPVFRMEHNVSNPTALSVQQFSDRVDLCNI